MAIKRLKGKYANLAAKKGKPTKAKAVKRTLGGIIAKKKLPPPYSAKNMSSLPAENLYQGKYVVDRNVYAQKILPSYQEARLRGISYESWMNNILPEQLRSVRKEIEIHAHGYNEPKASASNATMVPTDVVSRTIPTVQIKHPVAKREPVPNTRVPAKHIGHQPPNPYMAGNIDITTDNITEALQPIEQVEHLQPSNLDNSEPIGVIAPQPGAIPVPPSDVVPYSGRVPIKATRFPGKQLELSDYPNPWTDTVNTQIQRFQPIKMEYSNPWTLPTKYIDFPMVSEQQQEERYISPLLPPPKNVQGVNNAVVKIGARPHPLMIQSPVKSVSRPNSSRAVSVATDAGIHRYIEPALDPREEDDPMTNGQMTVVQQRTRHKKGKKKKGMLSYDLY